MARGGGCACRCFMAVAAVAVIALLVLLVAQYKHPTPPRYYASIVAVSGVRDTRRRMQFALTLGVESRSPLRGRTCLQRGTTVEVSYHGVALAYGATGQELCVGTWELWTLRKTTVVARRSNVVSGLLPEFVVEGLAADERRGAQVFDVTVRIPATRQDGAGRDNDGKLASCMARLVGDDNADACQVHYS